MQVGGASCTANTDCNSGFCTDSVCCNSACGAGACDACSTATGATSNGVCKIKNGTTCDDGNAQTSGDICNVQGICGGKKVRNTRVSTTILLFYGKFTDQYRYE